MNRRSFFAALAGAPLAAIAPPSVPDGRAEYFRKMIVGIDGGGLGETLGSAILPASRVLQVERGIAANLWCRLHPALRKIQRLDSAGAERSLLQVMNSITRNVREIENALRIPENERWTSLKEKS